MADLTRVVADRLAPTRVITDREQFDDTSFPAPWIVIDFPPPALAHDRWESSSFGRQTGWFQTTAVGESRAQAFRVHDERVVPRILDWVPVVDGWPSVWPVRMMLDTARVLDGVSKLPDRRLVEVVMRWSWQAERTV